MFSWTLYAVYGFSESFLVLTYVSINSKLFIYSLILLNFEKEHDLSFISCIQNYITALLLNWALG